MPLLTTNMALSKGIDADDSEGYLVTSLAASLDIMDGHRHSGGADGLPIKGLVFNVMAPPYEAKGDRLTDDTVAIQTAAAAIPAAGGILYFPVGQYITTGTITIPANTVVLGAGIGNTVIYKNSGTLHLFSCAGSKVQIHLLTIDSTLAIAGHSAGAAIYLAGGGGYRVENVEIADCFDGITLDNPAMGQVWLSQLVFSSLKGTGFQARQVAGPVFGRAWWISNVNDGTRPTSTGIYLHQLPGGGHFSDIQIYGCASYGVRIQPDAGKVVSDVFWSQVVSDSNFAGPGWEINGSGAGSGLYRMRFVNCWGSTNYGHGFHTLSAEMIEFANCIAINGDLHGLFVDAGSVHVKVAGGVYSGNYRLGPTWHGAGQAPGGPYAGIEVGAGIGDFDIVGVKAGATMNFAVTPNVVVPVDPSQVYGIRIEAGTGDHYSVLDCDVRGNVTAGILNGATGLNKEFRSNRGFNPYGVLGPPAMPASTVAIQNPYGIDSTVYVWGGTVTTAAVGGSGIGAFAGGAIRVAAGQTVSLTYSVLPSWQWFGD